MSFLLDTNVLSETSKPQPDDVVKTWLHNVDEDLLFVSAVTLAELRFGIERLAFGARRTQLEIWLHEGLVERLGSRLLVVDSAVATEWGTIQAQSEARGRLMNSMDCFLAATARVHQLVMVTRDTEHFSGAGCELFNPWTS
ncbi:MAG TPA: type II toxin-antitoxin system VapC family toxin [Candidatus Acidoferrum sp.]|nr:type II toxin-antitoxin system VapC family toxin [Candidatus Acidoferrum sp.]